MSTDCPRDLIALGFFAITTGVLLLAIWKTGGHRRQ